MVSRYLVARGEGRRGGGGGGDGRGGVGCRVVCCGGEC